MAKVNPHEVYKEYLAWFAELAKTPTGVAELRDRKAFGEWHNMKAEPIPYTFGLWLINDKNSGVDEVKLRTLMIQRRVNNQAKYSEAFKHVGGNPNAPLLDPKYEANAKAWHEENARRRAADPEWMANDAFTNEANRISQSGPSLYEKWEKENPKPELKPHQFIAPPKPKKKGLFDKVKEYFTSGPADVPQTHSFMDLQDEQSRAEFEKLAGKK